MDDDHESVRLELWGHPAGADLHLHGASATGRRRGEREAGLRLHPAHGSQIDEATVSITDDDVPSVSVSFGQASYTVAEGSSVQVKVTLERGPRADGHHLPDRQDRTGRSHGIDDYSGVQETVVFSSGETEQTFTFTAASDDVDDDGESVKLTFGYTLPTGRDRGQHRRDDYIDHRR